MKKSLLLLIIAVVLIPLLVLTGCQGGESEPEQEVSKSIRDKEDKDKKVTGDKIEVENDKEGETKAKSNNENSEYYTSPFTGKLVEGKLLRKVLMVSIENSPAARPQSGLQSADIIYEFLVEGGITRFLALYWHDIPGKIGPVRSLRPYFIKTAVPYNPLLLHAGASPEGFKMLSEIEISNLDQIYNGKYYWRDSNRNRPHNLYTGYFKFANYLNQLTGQEYSKRFSFQQIKLIKDKVNKAENININYWGNYSVKYKYSPQKNVYNRFLNFEQPHLTEDGQQLTAKNIIIKFVDTSVKDDIGRLKMTLNGRGKALIFRDGVVIKGYWKSEENKLTEFYTAKNKDVKLNPGQTWIQVVPKSIVVNYGKGEINGQGSKR